MDKIKILVCCHKPYNGYRDEVYTPIHVGRAISKYKDEMQEMIGDDTGEHISEKNPYYCELTAQYWAWKNVKDVEYIGFCHYRRFFDVKFTAENIDGYMRNVDVVALRYGHYHSIYWDLLRYVTLEDLTVLLMVLKKKYPEYEKTMIDYLYGNVVFPRNMFVFKKQAFDEYATWLFDILFECEKYIKPSPYTRGKRYMGYFGETLLTVYLMHNYHHILFLNEDNDEHGSFRVKLFYMRRLIVAKGLEKLKFLIEKKKKSLEEYYLPEVLVGFENDHIHI